MCPCKRRVYEKRSCSLQPSLEVLQGSTRSEDLHVGAVTLDLALLEKSLEIRVNVRGESVFTGDENLLTARELELGTTEGLLGVSDVVDLSSDGNQNRAN